MRPLTSLALLATLLTFGFLHAADYYLTGDEAEFASACRVYRSPSSRREALGALQRFVSDYSASPMAASAYFSIGEIQFDQGLETLAANQRIGQEIPQAATDGFRDAKGAYETALGKTQDPILQETIRHRLGELAFNEGDWRQASELFTEVADSKKAAYLRPLGLINLAYSQAADGDFKASEQTVRRLTESYPHYVQDASVPLLKGIVAMATGKNAEAEKYLKPIDLPQARYYLGWNYLSWDKPLLAASTFEKLYSDNPPPPLRETSKFFTGDAFYLSKDYEGAIGIYKEFLREFPDSRFKPAALLGLGSAYFQHGAYEQARSSYRELISQFGRSDYAELARYFTAESFRAQNKLPEALAAYGDLASAARRSLQPVALYKYAWVQRLMGDPNGTIRTCDKFIHLFPNSKWLPNVLLIAGNTMIEMGRLKDASGYLDRIRDVAPKSPIAEQALYLMVKLQYERRDYNYIVTTYQYLLKGLGPSVSKWRDFSYLLVADADLRLGRVKEAATIYKMILKDHIDDVAMIYAQDGLAWCEDMAGETHQAIVDRQKIRSMIQVASSSAALTNLNDLGLADSFFAQKDYSNAYDFYSKFVKEHPDLPAASTAAYRAGDCLFNERYYSDAIDTWKKLVASMPHSSAAQMASVRIADTLFRQRQYPQAETAYNQILAGDPQDETKQAAFTLVRLAQIAFLQKNNAKALSLAQNVLIHHPEAAESNDALDLVENIFEKAPDQDFRAFVENVAQVAPNTPAAAQAEFRLARRLFDEKKYADAIPEFQRFSVSHAADPQLPKAQFFLGESFFSLKDYAKAAPVLERYAANYASTPEAPIALVHLGACYFNLKQWDKTSAPFQQLMSKYPQSEYVSTARYNLALALHQSGDLDKARVAYEGVIRTSRQSDQVLPSLWNLVEIDQKEGSLSGALRNLRRIRDMTHSQGENAIEAVYKMGEIQDRLGDKPGSRKTWESLAKMKPASNAYRLQGLIELTKIYEKNRDYRKAYAVYRDLSVNATVPSVAQAARQRMKEIRSVQAGAGKGSEE